MSKEKSFNYRAINCETGEKCSHHHHSREHALSCADNLGWTHRMVERFDGSDGGEYKQSVGYCKRKEITLEEAKMWLVDAM